MKVLLVMTESKQTEIKPKDKELPIKREVAEYIALTSHLGILCRH